MTQKPPLLLAVSTKDIYTLTMAHAIRKELKRLADPQKVLIFKRFFKTGVGEYAEGDQFLGVTVPELRKIVRMYRDTDLVHVRELLSSDIHEERFIALQLLVERFSRGNERERTRVFHLYMRSLAQVNNWDLVDSSAPNIVGQYLIEKNKSPLTDLARSRNLWKRRVSIVATFAFIRKNDFDETLKISRILLHDSHDLIHKAVGWMLREVGNRNKDKEIEFLMKHYAQMPRTMLRYAIEKFPEPERKAFLKGVITS